MTTVDIIREAHSGWRYIVIAIAILALLKLLIGWLGGQRWSRLDQRLGAALPIVFDIQLLLGIVLWIMGKAWLLSPDRAWEHPVTMILAIVAAHMGWSRAKRSPNDASKYGAAFVGFLIAALLMGVGVARITGYMG